MFWERVANCATPIGDDFACPTDTAPRLAANVREIILLVRVYTYVRQIPVLLQRARSVPLVEALRRARTRAAPLAQPRVEVVQKSGARVGPPGSACAAAHKAAAPPREHLHESVEGVGAPAVGLAVEVAAPIDRRPQQPLRRLPAARRRAAASAAARRDGSRGIWPARGGRSYPNRSLRRRSWPVELLRDRDAAEHQRDDRAVAVRSDLSRAPRRTRRPVCT